MRHTFIWLELSTLRTAEYGARRLQTKFINECPLHSDKCTALCTLSANGIIGPLWFQEQGESVTINQERYRSVIDTFHGLLQRLRFESQWFQQDGATPHTATATMRHLNELFGENVISKKSAFPWSPRSLDLSPLDFFLRELYGTDRKLPDLMYIFSFSLFKYVASFRNY